MVKKILIILFIIFFLGTGIYYINTKNSDFNTPSTPSESPKMQQPTPTEEEIATFSTQIYNKDSARQNNISITCTTLNGTEVLPGSTFSFCDTVGKATSEKGYQEADIFVSGGKKAKGLGGGNCQVSTTLYNAVLLVPSLTVEERHAHSNSVPYIESGKDAAVAYGSYDFKFINNLENTVRIDVQNTEDDITVKLVTIK